MNVNRRKMKPADFNLFEGGKFNNNWPMGYNFLLGSVDFDYPSKKKPENFEQFKLSVKNKKQNDI